MVIVVLLLAANVLMLAWQQGWLGGPAPSQAEREPARMSRQVNPEAIQVLSPVAASAALAEAARAASAAASGPDDAASGSATGAAAAPASAASPAPAGASSAASAPARASSAPARAASSVAAIDCLEAGPFAATELPAAERAMRAASMPAGLWRVASSQRPGNYLIYMGRFTDESVLQRKQGELQRRKVEFKPMTDWPDLQPGLVLGRFADKAAADAGLALLAQRGVHTARVVTLTPSGTLATLRVPAATAEQRAQLATLKLPPTGLGFAPCPAEPGKA
jgi:hypothetical protein